MALKVHNFKPVGFEVTNEMKKDFDDDGFVFVKNMFSRAEIKHIETALKEGNYENRGIRAPDEEGMEAYMTLWNHPGEDVTGMVARSMKLVNTCEKLIEGEVYHYHTKLMSKPAKLGGKNIWHQDYGYWYLNGCLFPKMMTVFIAIDKCSRGNGCLQILPGSHKCGRIEHGKMGSQIGANVDRVEEIAKVCPLEYVEMEPGDALFFHCNLLHCSSANLSEDRRWALLCAYNRTDNNPTIDHHHPRYTPLQKVEDSAILECKNFIPTDDKWFIDNSVLKTLEKQVE